MQRDDVEFAAAPSVISEQDVRACRAQVLRRAFLGLAAEEETKRLIGLFVVLGMVALILKGFLIARWFRVRKQRRSGR